MKKRLSLLVASAFALMLSFALVGCGGGEDYSANFQGSWKLCAMEDESGVTSEEDIAMLEAFGMTITLNLNEDKSAALDMMGEAATGTWEAKSATECSVTIDGDTITGKLADGKLTLADSTASMTFVKLEGAEAEAAAAAAASAGSITTAEPVVDEDFVGSTIADDDICTIEVVGKKTDDWGDSGYLMNITNKTDIAIYVTFPFDAVSVDGVMVDIWGGATLQPGTTVNEAFFYADSEDVPNIDALTNVKGTIEVWDDDSLDTLASYEVSLN